MSSTTNIYLDIDGVLLANDLNPANFAKEFIQHVLSKYPYSTYWLTTHCMGNPDPAIRHLAPYFDNATIGLLKKIKPTSWDMANKTKAIDFTKPFLWFDDDLFHDEEQALIDHGVLDNWIEVNLRKDENQLLKFIDSFPIPVR